MGGGSCLQSIFCQDEGQPKHLSVPPSISSSICQSVYLFTAFCLSRFGLLVTSHRMRMSVFSGIYGPFLLPSEGLITPRSEVGLCIFIFFGLCVEGGSSTHPAGAYDSTWWSWSVISEGRKYSTETDEVFPMWSISVELHVGACMCVRL